MKPDREAAIGGSGKVFPAVGLETRCFATDINISGAINGLGGQHSIVAGIHAHDHIAVLGIQEIAHQINGEFVGEHELWSAAHGMGQGDGDLVFEAGLAFLGIRGFFGRCADTQRFGLCRHAHQAGRCAGQADDQKFCNRWGHFGHFCSPIPPIELAGQSSFFLYCRAFLLT